MEVRRRAGASNMRTHLFVLTLTHTHKRQKRVPNWTTSVSELLPLKRITLPKTLSVKTRF